jgi:hypothetical protein
LIRRDSSNFENGNRQPGESVAADGAQGAQHDRALQGLTAVVRPLKHPSIHHARLVRALAEAGRRVEALAELENASCLPGGRAEDHEHLAFMAFGLGAHEIARAMYARVAQLLPGDATAWYNLASSERTLGRLDVAEQACDRALALDPGMAKAALLRSQLRAQRPDANHVHELRRWLAKAPDDGAVVLLSYALGKELDDLGDYDEAFRYFSMGASNRRRNLSYDVERDAWKLRRIRETFDAQRLLRAPPLQATEYGFIVGLPRSGTTMIERVLTGNPEIVANGETDHLLKALMDGSQPDEQDVFLRIAESDPSQVRRAYAQRAADPWGRRLVLEKLPFNYLYAGAIRLTLPQARILLVTRSPADNCFAMFSTLFGSGYPFSYDLAELARYFVAYRELMAHWMAVLPDQMLEVSYEGFIEHPAKQGARLAAHLGVEWSDTMVNIENNPASTATASAAQVRRPIYKTAAGRWRNYATHLGPLLGALEAAGVDPCG